MARFLIGAFGTRGDVQPMAALTQALVARGHSAKVAVPPNALAFAQKLGLDCFPVGLDYEEVSRRNSNGTFKEVLATMPMLRAEVGRQLEAMEEHAASADLIVGCSAFTVGAVLAELHHKPYSFFAFCPQLFRSGDHPSPPVPWHGLPRWFNRLTWAFNTVSWRWVLGRVVDELRARRKLPRTWDVWASITGALPIVACDPRLGPAPADHAHRVSQPGPLFLNETDALSPETDAFLSAGAPPVYLGFGSMSVPNPEQTTARLLETVHRAGARALISRGWAGLAGATSTANTLFIGPEPHGKLFPRCAAVIHHGGAGTTHAAARAGVPQVVMPQLLDQYYWAHKVKKAGLGSDVLRHGRDLAGLERAVRSCLEDDALKARAKHFGAAMPLDGVDRAVELLERHAAA